MPLDEPGSHSPGNGKALTYESPSARISPSGHHRIWPWLLVLVVIAGGAYLLYWRIHSMTQAKAAGKTRAAAGRAVPVVVAPARAGDINIFYEGLGTVTPLQTVTVRSRVDGELMNVYFKEGQIVQKGQPLVLVDPGPYEAAQKQAEGQLQRDQALLKNAQLDLQRYQSVQQSVTQQQIDTQAALVSQYQGTVTMDEAAVTNAKLNVGFCHINAPLTGRIGLRLVDAGNIVHANDTQGLAVITQLQPIAVYFSLPEDEIHTVFQQPNQGQGLTVVAYDRNDRRQVATGTLAASDSEIDPGSGTLRFEAVFDNKSYEMFPSQFVNAWLLVNTLHDSLIVPTAAVQRGPSGETFIYVVKKDKTVALRDVKVGHPIGDERVRFVADPQGDYTAISGGLKEGEMVVTDGIDKLQQGTAVQATQEKRQPRRSTTRPTTRPGGAGATTQPAGMPLRTGARRGRPQGANK